MKGSSLFLLPHLDKTFDRIFEWDSASTIIFDMEDGCPKSKKEYARKNIVNNCNKIKSLKACAVLRVNPLSDIDELSEDLKLLRTGAFEGILLTKLNRDSEVLEIERILSQVIRFEWDISIHLLIETVAALNNLSALATVSLNVKSLCIGMHDLNAELNADNNEFTNDFIRLKTIAVAKENNLAAIDTPFLDVKNFSELYKRCKHIKEMGMDGSMCIHPDHVNVINRTFLISEERIDELGLILADYTEGCIMSNGVFIGPPTVKKMRKELGSDKQIPQKNEHTLKPKSFHYGLDLSDVYTGQIINCPYEITMDESWITSWSSLISMGNYIETSKEFAIELGLKNRVLPFSAMVNLTLCMAVEPFSESCLLHLGLEEVKYESPAYPGDTFRCFILIEKIRNTSDGKRSVIKSHHVLVNQKNERVISFERNTLFNRVEEIKESIRKAEYSELEKVILNKTDAENFNLTAGSSKRSGRALNKHLEKNDLLLHDAMRHIGESENLLFTTLFRNTHPIHFNYIRYKPEQIIVCGGFVMAVVLGNAMKDFKQVITQKIYNCSHINKVTPGDSLSTASYIYDKVIQSNIETLKIVTLGFIDLDPAKDLVHRNWPIEIFSIDTPRPKVLEEFLKEEFPEMFHRICIHIHWEITRVNS